MAKTQRILLTVIGIAIVALLAAIAAIVIPILTHETGGASGQIAPEDFVAEVTAEGDDGRTRVLRAVTDDGSAADLSALHAGEQIIVEGEGFDTSIGIYVGFCRVPDEPGTKPGPCLAGIPEEMGEADINEAIETAWITNDWAWRAFATGSYDNASEGTFAVRLVVPDPVGEGVDCRVDACGIYTRADHTAAQDRVQDVYLPFAMGEHE